MDKCIIKNPFNINLNETSEHSVKLIKICKLINSQTNCMEDIFVYNDKKLMLSYISDLIKSKIKADCTLIFKLIPISQLNNI